MRQSHHKLLPSILAIFCACALLAARPTLAADSTAGKLIIVKAEYGDLDSDKTLNVTAKLAAMVKDNSLDVDVANSALGTPPGKGPFKLKVGFSIDGLYSSKTVNQGETLDVSTRLIIRKAVYGDLPKGAQVDVTDQIADAVRRNNLSIEATNDRFGGDPASGVVKKLRVDYTLDGVDKSKTVLENEMLTISAAADAKKK